MTRNELRAKYLKDCEDVVDTARKHYKSEYVDTHMRLILRFYVFCRNWACDRQDQALDIHDYIQKEYSKFYDALSECVKDTNKRYGIYVGMKKVLDAMRNIEQYKERHFYSEFLEDLECMAGIKVKGKYYFWIPPSIYDCSEDEYKAEIEMFKKGLV